eukprot:TRINITY_DN4205_c0_g1_i1.p1 TRINITY_DN4205_c0_g1~~TRINITY_DN4205_c0_g1_i1.p1  ORF type:complete len:409 (+),score=58.48 TRINITY_DN4205_c0_g1_i1:129-1355(+)
MGRDTGLFVQNEIDQDFLCSICLNVIVDPQDTPCGHTYCKKCIQEALKKSGSKEQRSCAECRTPLTTKDLKPSSVKFRSFLNKLQVFCDTRMPQEASSSETPSEVCPWQGEWSNLQHHIDNDCEFVKVICKYKECGKAVQKRSIVEHETNCNFRTTTCEYCAATINFHNMSKHVSKCPQFPVKCVCGEDVPRASQADHVKNKCTDVKVNCMYYGHGCTEPLSKKEVDIHMEKEMSKHLHMITKSFDTQGKKVKELEDKLESELKTLKAEMKLLTKQRPRGGGGSHYQPKFGRHYCCVYLSEEIGDEDLEFACGPTEWVLKFCKKEKKDNKYGLYLESVNEEHLDVSIEIECEKESSSVRDQHVTFEQGWFIRSSKSATDIPSFMTSVGWTFPLRVVMELEIHNVHYCD